MNIIVKNKTPSNQKVGKKVKVTVRERDYQHPRETFNKEQLDRIHKAVHFTHAMNMKREEWDNE